MTAYGLDKDKLLTRLRRIEGQVRGLQRMIEEDKYCIDIITQVSSVQAALEQISLGLMENHMRHCVTEAIQEGNGETKIGEVMEVLRRYAKSPSAARGQETEIG
jgi:DNA-binding FrmR family transcriptional regulator